MLVCVCVWVSAFSHERMSWRSSVLFMKHSSLALVGAHPEQHGNAEMKLRRSLVKTLSHKKHSGSVSYANEKQADNNTHPHTDILPHNSN